MSVCMLPIQRLKADTIAFDPFAGKNLCCRTCFWVVVIFYEFESQEQTCKWHPIAATVSFSTWQSFMLLCHCVRAVQCHCHVTLKQPQQRILRGTPLLICHSGKTDRLYSLSQPPTLTGVLIKCYITNIPGEIKGCVCTRVGWGVFWDW